MYQIERDTVISEILINAPYTGDLYYNNKETLNNENPFQWQREGRGVHLRSGESLASGENVEEACEVHGVDADLFVRHVNDFISSHS